MKVHWTAAARAQLKAIHVYISQTSPQYAQQVVDRLTRRSQQLAAFPLSARVITEANDVSARELIEGPYRIIYHMVEGQVDVIAVVHSAQQWPPAQ